MKRAIFLILGIITAATIFAQTTPVILVKGGTFQMGSESGEEREKPVHEVRVSDFYIGTYEVTQKEYAALMGTNPSFFKGNDLPLERVTWNEAVAYCNKLSERDGLKPAYTTSDTGVSCDWSANGWRLPTEAEWEYAARGGAQSRGYKYAGSDDADAVAWYVDSSGFATHPVGTKAPNELGLYDMSGNASEWVWDRYGSYSAESQSNPRGSTSGSYRGYRGGSWSSDAGGARSTNRLSGHPLLRLSYLGFRLLRPSSP